MASATTNATTESTPKKRTSAERAIEALGFGGFSFEADLSVLGL